MLDLLENGILSPQRGSLTEIIGKEKRNFTKKDLMSALYKLGIQMLNFRFVAGDGRLKTFSFVTSNRRHVDRILSTGERVDGSSLFPTVDAGSSDLYVVPRTNSAYINPFAPVPTVDVLCSFFTHEGEPLNNDPSHLCLKAQEALKRSSGFTMESLGELEYYVISQPSHLFPTCTQRGYGESAPFARHDDLRNLAMVILGNIGYSTKYGHAEVGQSLDSAREMVQHEIEFNLAPIEESADAIVLARWVLRMLAARMGVTVTFTPKLMFGHAGSGLHIHTRLVKDGRSVIGDGSGLTETAYRVLAGYLTMAPSLTAFGNPIPVSFLRLVPNHEAPVYVCWGARNRSALIRVPLGWVNVGNMAAKANPQDPEAMTPVHENQTLEVRSPDGAANVHMLHAALAVAARHGLEMPDALEVTRRLRVDSNIFKGDPSVRQHLPQLPTGCRDAGVALLERRDIYEKYGVFSPATIDGVASVLAGHWEEDKVVRGAESLRLHDIIEKYLHCG